MVSHITPRTNKISAFNFETMVKDWMNKGEMTYFEYFNNYTLKYAKTWLKESWIGILYTVDDLK